MCADLPSKSSYNKFRIYIILNRLKTTDFYEEKYQENTAEAIYINI